MSLVSYDAIQKKSFVVYVTMTDLEKINDEDRADVCQLYYSV
jgi:hypothetical protein